MKKKNEREKKNYPQKNPQEVHREKRKLSTEKSGKNQKNQFLISSIIPQTKDEKSGSVAIAESTFLNAAIIVA